MNESVPKLPVLSWQGISLAHAPARASLLDLPAVRFTTSGRAAIWHALRLIGLKPGDRVLMPSYHCMSMIAPVVLLGGEVEFYPIVADGSADVLVPRLRGGSGRHLRLIQQANGPAIDVQLVKDATGAAIDAALAARIGIARIR